MFKKLFVIFTMSFSLFLYGCSPSKDVSLESIITCITDSFELDSMVQGDSKSLKRYFGLNSNDFDDFIIYTPSYTMDVNELLIIKVKDTSQIDFVQDTIEGRIDKQIETFGSYGPEQCALLEDYELKVKGNYIFYAVSENADDLVKSFKESIK